ELKQLIKQPPEYKPYLTTVPERKLEKIPVKQCRRELFDYRKYIHSTVAWDEGCIQKLDDIKENLPAQYRKEAVDIWINNKYADQLKKLEDKGAEIQKEVKAFEDKGSISKWFSGKERDELSRKVQNHNYEVKNLNEIIERDRSELNNPLYLNKGRFDGYEVKKFIEDYTREKDPNYDKKLEAIGKVKAEVLTRQKSSREVGKVVFNLEEKLKSIKDQDKLIGMTSPYIEGKRLTLAQTKDKAECMKTISSIGFGGSGRGLEIGKGHGNER
ncbi:MAG: hypothetical protein GX951_06015, partial [Mollicutes bacterium]|nr:hypothetical protein [Mollicutes bacterium]